MIIEVIIVKLCNPTSVTFKRSNYINSYMIVGVLAGKVELLCNLF